ncbi:conserved Plasmodium protein, unknown function [Plasmodium vinckei vinckei]|uniref:Uncharacterized protein n=1 Tax=Plasmodium vinckei vinckei TaxID=54757 RepID=A0A081ICP9_PLAVN|nr:conserved Plasmodium protein, unknown function [Plasmodium vinckei vinckei]KEG01457.1 hypothetical protein YYE_03553 [Plasmodium vinckei vinckei]VEV55437.1 conserved Plasmodium protein, unknown function [Plasmodium vinckei vinckei]
MPIDLNYDQQIQIKCSYIIEKYKKKLKKLKEYKRDLKASYEKKNKAYYIDRYLFNKEKEQLYNEIKKKREELELEDLKKTKELYNSYFIDIFLYEQEYYQCIYKVFKNLLLKKDEIDKKERHSIKLNEYAYMMFSDKNVNTPKIKSEKDEIKENLNIEDIYQSKVLDKIDKTIYTNNSPNNDLRKIEKEIFAMGDLSIPYIDCEDKSNENSIYLSSNNSQIIKLNKTYSDLNISDVHYNKNDENCKVKKSEDIHSNRYNNNNHNNPETENNNSFYEQIQTNIGTLDENKEKDLYPLNTKIDDENPNLCDNQKICSQNESSDDKQVKDMKAEEIINEKKILEDGNSLSHYILSNFIEEGNSPNSEYTDKKNDIFHVNNLNSKTDKAIDEIYACVKTKKGNKELDEVIENNINFNISSYFSGSYDEINNNETESKDHISNSDSFCEDFKNFEQDILEEHFINENEKNETTKYHGTMEFNKMFEDENIQENIQNEQNNVVSNKNQENYEINQMEYSTNKLTYSHDHNKYGSSNNNNKKNIKNDDHAEEYEYMKRFNEQNYMNNPKILQMSDKYNNEYPIPIERLNTFKNHAEEISFLENYEENMNIINNVNIIRPAKFIGTNKNASESEKIENFVNYVGENIKKRGILD